MGRYLSINGGYGILIEDEIPNEEMMSKFNIDGEDFYDFCETIMEEENKNKSNPCKLSYGFGDVNDYLFGFYIIQKDTSMNNFDPCIKFDPNKLIKVQKYDDFLIRVAKRFGIENIKPAWFVVSSYG